MNEVETPADLLDARLRLEELVDRAGLGELCKSFHTLFGIPVRVYSSEGLLLADAVGEHEVCAYVNTTTEGRRACGATVSAVKAHDPGPTKDLVHPCFTGAAYRILVIEYDGRPIGRLILGPYLPSSLKEPPKSLLVDRAIQFDQARTLLLRMPRAKTETISRIALHLKGALDLILFSGHKTLLTSQMHLASVRESFRELQEKNAKLQQAYDKLKELDRLKSNFLATVSHELRTPLTSIIGYSEMLAEGIAGELTTEQKEFVGTIYEKGEQLLQLIMGLLDLSKLESGTMSMRRKELAIGSVLSEVMSTLAPTARKKGVMLDLDMADDLHDLRGDPERLRQVFLNLTENAIKFTPSEGTVTLQARMVQDTGGQEDDDGFALLAPTQMELEVRVIDTGIGIPSRERSRVFDAFYQVDSSSTREYGGTGLGLAIVKRLVEAHGGNIGIEGNEPEGSVFVVRFPIGSSPEVAQRTPGL
ncbi:MAG: ATP-binding protein [Myxococcales bacterium]